MLKIQVERQARGWSIAELSRRSGLNASTLGQIENGRFKPYANQLVKVAVAFGVDPAEAPGLVEVVAGGAGAGAPAPAPRPPMVQLLWIVRKYRYREAVCRKHGAVVSGLCWNGPHLGEYCPEGCWIGNLVQAPGVVALAPPRTGTTSPAQRGAGEANV